MSQKEIDIWNYFKENSLTSKKPFDREFVWIDKHTFSKRKSLFKEDLNLLHSGRSYRSGGLLRHIHAVEQGDIIFVHCDFGNVSRSLILGVFHLFLDVIPYIIFSAVTGQKLKDVFKYSE